MKITVWIRPDRNDPRGITLRADWKPESLDTPSIQYYGRKLFNAIEGTAAPAPATAQSLTQNSGVAEGQSASLSAAPPLCASALKSPTPAAAPAPKGTP